MLEVDLRKQPDESYQYVEGYFFTVDKLVELVRDFQADCHDGFVSNDTAYIENWIKDNGSESSYNKIKT